MVILAHLDSVQNMQCAVRITQRCCSGQAVSYYIFWVCVRTDTTKLIVAF